MSSVNHGMTHTCLVQHRCAPKTHCCHPKNSEAVEPCPGPGDLRHKSVQIPRRPCADHPRIVAVANLTSGLERCSHPLEQTTATLFAGFRGEDDDLRRKYQQNDRRTRPINRNSHSVPWTCFPATRTGSKTNRPSSGQRLPRSSFNSPSTARSLGVL